MKRISPEQFEVMLKECVEQSFKEKVTAIVKEVINENAKNEKQDLKNESTVTLWRDFLRTTSKILRKIFADNIQY